MDDLRNVIFDYFHNVTPSESRQFLNSDASIR
jgi:hypothetical protein